MDIISIKKNLRTSALNLDHDSIKIIISEQILTPLEVESTKVNWPFIKFLYTKPIFKKPLLDILRTNYTSLYGYFLFIKHEIMEDLIKENNYILVQAVRNYLSNESKTIYTKDDCNEKENVINNKAIIQEKINKHIDFGKFNESLITPDINNYLSYILPIVVKDNKCIIDLATANGIAESYEDIHLTEEINPNLCELLLNAPTTWIKTTDYFTKNNGAAVIITNDDDDNCGDNDRKIIDRKIFNNIISNFITFNVNNIVLHNYYAITKNNIKAFQNYRVPICIFYPRDGYVYDNPHMYENILKPIFYKEHYHNFVSKDSFLDEKIFNNSGNDDYWNTLRLKLFKLYYKQCLKPEHEKFIYLPECSNNEFNNDLRTTNDWSLIELTKYTIYNSYYKKYSSSTTDVKPIPLEISRHNAVMLFNYISLGINNNIPLRNILDENKNMITDPENKKIDIDYVLFSCLSFGKFNIISKEETFDTLEEYLDYYLNRHILSDTHIKAIISNLICNSTNYDNYKNILVNNICKELTKDVINNNLKYIFDENTLKNMLNTLGL